MFLDGMVTDKYIVKMTDVDEDYLRRLRIYYQTQEKKEKLKQLQPKPED